MFDDLLSCSALFCFGGIPLQLLMLWNRASAHVGSNKPFIVIFTNVLPAVPMAGVGIFCSWSHDHLPRILQLCSFLLALQWCEFKTYVLVSKKYYWLSAAASSKTTQRGKKRFFSLLWETTAGGKTGSHLSSTLKYYCSLLLNWMMILQISKDKHASILLLSSSKFTRERQSAPFLPHILES